MSFHAVFKGRRATETDLARVRWLLDNFTDGGVTPDRPGLKTWTFAPPDPEEDESSIAPIEEWPPATDDVKIPAEGEPTPEIPPEDEE